MVANNHDTIVAIATPPGKGGVGVVRVSGPLVQEIAKAMLCKMPEERKAVFTPFKSHNNAQNNYNKDRNKDHDQDPNQDHNPEIIDEGIALFFKAPNSFTGEDVLELQGHGGPFIMDALVKTVLDLGARGAEPGEFSLRAFLNGKMDLSQAEAVSDLINANSVQAARSALRSMQGDFAKVVTKFIEDLINLRMYVEASLDFPEEEIDLLKEGQVNRRLVDLLDQLTEIKTVTERGARLSQGQKVVIAGKPNAGKSSLLNLFAGVDAAIVTDIPGTTRDVLKTEIQFEGMVLQVMDTAGLRSDADVIEQEGIRRALQEMHTADHVVWVVDVGEYEFASEFPPAASAPEFPFVSTSGSESNSAFPFVSTSGSASNSAFPSAAHISISAPLSPSTINRNADAAKDPFWDHNNITTNRTTTILFNKIDAHNIEPLCQTKNGYTEVYASVKTGEGMSLFWEALKNTLFQGTNNHTQFSARRRHVQALSKAHEHLSCGQNIFQKSGDLSLLAEELKLAQTALEEITGKFTSDDLLGKIFSEFCIGK